MVDAGRGGRIVNITSIHERYPVVGNARQRREGGPRAADQGDGAGATWLADGGMSLTGLIAGSALQDDSWRQVSSS